ncbi:MAG: anaerobic ribonucleoside-triphosphate reductase activating protein [Eubacteriales bacterium]
MNYAAIKPRDVANGPGVRVSLFVSGCTHHCEGCFQPETWDFSYGNPFTQMEEQEILNHLGRDYIAGLTLLGGEPLEPQNQVALLPLLRRVRGLYPEKNIWCFTGYTLEDDILAKKLGDFDITAEILSYLDVLVDGEFVEHQKNLNLRFRGSENQRLLDIPKTLEANCAVLWSDGSERT